MFPMHGFSPLTQATTLTSKFSPAMMKGVHFLVTVVLFALASSFVSAYDPSPLQDFCVAINNPIAAVFVNGKFCKNPKVVTANDFFFSGLNIPRSTANPLGSNVTLLSVDMILGLNTLGISLVRVDFTPYGLNPPHTHPRGTKILVVIEGTLLVGFVTSNPNNTFISKVLITGDVFVFPIGLIHFQFNVGKTPAVVFSVLSSQNLGVILIASVVFGSNPPISLVLPVVVVIWGVFLNLGRFFLISSWFILICYVM